MPLASRTFGDLITFTRGSTGSYFDSSGVLQSAAINTPRFDYDPVTLAARGILIETSITNRVRNNTMVGAVAGTPGTLPTNWSTFTTLTGLTREVVGTGTESGISYIDVRLSGTPSGAGAYNIYPETVNSAAAATGQTWTYSAYIRLAAGTLTGVSGIQMVVAEYSATPTYLDGTFTTVTPPTGSPLVEQRVFATRALNQATTAFVSPQTNLVLTGGAIDITLRIGVPQLEQLPFVTSVVSTSGTAVTRSIETVLLNTLSPWYNATQGAVYAQVSVNTLSPTLTNRVVAISDGTTSNIIAVSRNGSSGRARLAVVTGGVSQVAVEPGLWSTLASVKLSAAYATDSFATTINAGAVTVDNLGTVPTVTSVRLGADNSGNFLNGHIQRFDYYPVRLTNADLQAITV